MASIITATTTSGLTQSADNSGVLQLASGTGNLVTVPSVTGTAMVSGNMPAFSATIASTQTITAGTFTKIAFATEVFDTANCYDPTTNYRFTPNVAGYYQINLLARLRGVGASTNKILAIRKNGSTYRNIDQYPTSIEYFSLFLSSLVYMNGTTDYLEAWVYSDGTSTSVNYDSNITSEFSGSLVRSA